MTDVQIGRDKWEVRSLHSDDERESRDVTEQISNQTGNINSPANGDVKVDKRKNNAHNGKSNHNGRKFSRKLWKVFGAQNSSPVGGKVTPVDDDSRDGQPSPAFKAFSRKSEKAMKANSSSADKVKNISMSDGRKEDSISSLHVSHYSNPAFTNTIGYEGQGLHEFDQPSRSRRSYEAPIYSVNSAGRPVPITIEESENEGDEAYQFSGDNDEFETESREESSESPPLPSASAIFPRKICCCISMNRKNSVVAALTNLWRNTYLPSSTIIFVWLCVVTTAFLYNLWSIPLRATFQSEIQTPWRDIWFSLDAICDFIYVVDIFIKFRTSFIQSGVFITDLNRLNRYHRRQWTLVLDIIAILPTDLLFIHSINPYFRLNRVLKVHRVFNFYQFGELSTWSPNFWRSLNLVHIFFVVIHYNACIYYALSSTNGFGNLLTSWSYPNPTFFPEYEPMHRRYTYSFYWCMVGLGLVNDRYFPETDWQFIFSIYLHFLGLTFLVIFIGFFTVVMFGILSPKFKFESTMQNTRDYMKQRKLPKELRSKVLRFYQYSWLSEQFPHLEEGNTLKSLPISVRQEIELHSNLNALKQIQSLARCDENILRDLVMKLRRTIYLPGQFIFKSGELGKELYIISEGILQIVNDGDPTVHTLREGDVFGEMDFLYETEKRRTADVVSYGYSEIYVLSSEDVVDTFRKYPKFVNQVQMHDRRRKVMTSNTREYKAFGAKYQSLPTSSVKSHRDSKLSSSKVHFQVLNGDARGFCGIPGSSPDSGVPSTPSMTIPYGGESPTVSYQDRTKTDVTDKITGLYQDHIKSLRASLDSIWYQEIAYLNQRLEDAEQERDTKVREISRLRRQLSKDNSVIDIPERIDEIKPTAKRKDSTTQVTKATKGSVDKNETLDANSSTSKKARSVKNSVKQKTSDGQPGIKT